MGKSISSAVKAKCPRCGKMHKHYFEQGGFWSGTGTPRYYCSFCLRTNESPYDLGSERNKNMDDLYDVTEFEAEQSQTYELLSLQGGR